MLLQQLKVLVFTAVKTRGTIIKRKKQMEKGMMFSPHLQYAQKAPEKTKAEERFERGEVG